MPIAAASQDTGVPTISPRRERSVRYGLIAIALASLVPMLILSASEFISYDGYWHLFIATQDNWKQFMFEYRGDAHPILYVLLLRALAWVNQSRLVLRFGSYLPGAISVYLVGVIAARLCRSRAYAWLAAAAYGFSITLLQINTDVRSYPLCLMFVLLAFNSMIKGVQAESVQQGNRQVLWFGLYTAAAIATEYYAVFFFVAAVVALAYVCAGKHRPSIGFTVSARVIAYAIGIPAATIAFLYKTHLRYQPKQYGHVLDFYIAPGQSVFQFLSHNLRLDLNYILPVAIQKDLVLLALAAAGLLVFLAFPFAQGKDLGQRIAGLPGVTCICLVGELAIAGLLRRYPFGGWERQQSIFFPFLILATFILLDWITSRISRHIASPAVAVVCGLLLGVHFASAWRKMPRKADDIFGDEYRAFEAARRTNAVYLDEFTFFAFYNQAHSAKWHFGGELTTPEQRIETYTITSPGKVALSVDRDVDIWNFDLTKPRDYVTAAAFMKKKGLGSMTILVGKQVPSPGNAAALQSEELTIRKSADTAGLQVSSMLNTTAEAVINVAFK